MRFGIFYEHQLPRPWSADDEHQLLKDALEQIELAEAVGARGALRLWRRARLLAVRLFDQ